jgi:hypothetical protein
MNDAFTPSTRTKLKRLPNRGAYDRASIYAVLDVGNICAIWGWPAVIER